MRLDTRANACAFAWAIGSVLGFVVAAPSALAQSQLVFFSDISGLSAEALFTLIDPTTLEIRLRNTSTGVPSGFEASDQLLTGVSWDFGHPGFNGDSMITGGTVAIGPTSQSVNFDQIAIQLGPGADVSGEWGFGNMDGTGALTNFLSANAAAATPFGGVNLDGPLNIDGPQGGLLANPGIVPLGGLGAVQFEVVSLLSLSLPISDLSFLNANGVLFEFGSDAFFLPTPSTLIFLGAGLATLSCRRRR